MGKLLTTIILIFLIFTSAATPALAQRRDELKDTLKVGFDIVQREVGWQEGTDLEIATLRVINVIMGFLGLLAIVIIIWAGFRWMTAGGEEEKIRTAKKILVAGAIGLAIIILAYAIARFVVLTLVNVTAPQ